MSLIIYYAILIALCSSLVESRCLKKSCKTSENENGTCVPINKCWRIANSIQGTEKQESPHITFNFNRRSCGKRKGVRYVCCPNKHTTTVATTITETPTTNHSTNTTTPPNITSTSTRTILTTARPTTIIPNTLKTFIYTIIPSTSTPISKFTTNKTPPTNTSTTTTPNPTPPISTTTNPVTTNTLPTTHPSNLPTIHRTTITATTANRANNTAPATTPSTAISRSADINLKFSDSNLTEIEDFLNHPNLKLLPKNCGPTNGNKVSHGEKTALNQYPFMVLLKHETRNGFDFKCAGTIINKRHILTAAHCVLKRAGELKAVRVGEHVISTRKDCEKSIFGNNCAPPAEDIEVEEIIIHPSYKPPFANDIALLRLKRDINFENKNMDAICLPINKRALQNHLQEVTTTGWGYIDHQNTRSDVLLWATLPILDLDECNNFYNKKFISVSVLCAGGKNQTSTCNGDSGGPIFYPTRMDKFPRYVQYGVVGAGYTICGSVINSPGIYTRVAYFMKWILDQLK